MSSITKQELERILSSKNFNEFHRITTGTDGSSNLYFLKDLVTLFPEYKEQLFNMATATTKEFHRITTGTDGSSNLYFLKDLVTLFPEYKEQLFNMATATTKEFHRITTRTDGSSNLYFLKDLVTLFPEYKEQLFNMATATTEELHRITIGTDGSSSLYFLKNLVTLFPENFNQLGINAPINVTFEQAFESIEKRLTPWRKLQKSKAEIMKNSSLIKQGERTVFSQSSPCFFNKVPTGVQEHIAGYTGIHDAHNIKGAKKPDDIAHKTMQKENSRQDAYLEQQKNDTHDADKDDHDETPSP